MKRIAILAALAVLAAGSVSAQTIGGGIGVGAITSQSGGSVLGGGVGGAVTSIQRSQTTGLAGTVITHSATGPKIVSEHNVTGSASQIGPGLSAFTGSSFSQGSFVGLSGFLRY